ncbi:MAG: hypothetical protein LBJ01_10920, partial [Tannerella sp.]|nr:hypothetical protein [Tannerella sp.]
TAEARSPKQSVPALAIASYLAMTGRFLPAGPLPDMTGKMATPRTGSAGRISKKYFRTGRVTGCFFLLPYRDGLQYEKANN